jgi:hypothetical protein
MLSIEFESYEIEKLVAQHLSQETTHQTDVSFNIIPCLKSIIKVVKYSYQYLAMIHISSLFSQISNYFTIIDNFYLKLSLSLQKYFFFYSYI